MEIYVSEESHIETAVDDITCYKVFVPTGDYDNEWISADGDGTPLARWDNPTVRVELGDDGYLFHYPPQTYTDKDGMEHKYHRVDCGNCQIAYKTVRDALNALEGHYGEDEEMIVVRYSIMSGDKYMTGFSGPLNGVRLRHGEDVYAVGNILIGDIVVTMGTFGDLMEELENEVGNDDNERIGGLRKLVNAVSERIEGLRLRRVTPSEADVEVRFGDGRKVMV